MEYAKQGPYISKVIYYQPIDATETSEQSTSDVDAPPPRSSPKSRNRYFIKYFRIAELLANEYNIHKRLSHKNIIPLIGIHQSPSGGPQGLAFPFLPNGSLQNLLYRRQNLPEHECLPYFHGMLDAVTYIHSIGVIHRDIKPENMMIGNNNEIQLIDFGSSLVLELQGNDQVSGTIGTPAFLAPECVQGTGEAYSGKKADIWALGITLALMLTGKLLYDGLTKYDVFEAIRMRPFDIENSELFRCISRHAVDLLTNALNRNPEERFDAMKLKESTWIKTYP